MLQQPLRPERREALKSDLLAWLKHHGETFQEDCLARSWATDEQFGREHTEGCVEASRAQLQFAMGNAGEPPQRKNGSGFFGAVGGPKVSPNAGSAVR